MIRAPLLATLALVAVVAPATAQEPDGDAKRRWEVSILDDWAALRWAIPDTDDASVTYACDLRSGTVRVLFYAYGRPAFAKPTQWPTPLQLRSGAVRFSTETAEAQVDELTDGTVIEAKLPLDAPVLAAFSTTGAMTITAHGDTSDAPPAPVADVAKFLRACRP